MIFYLPPRKSGIEYFAEMRKKKRDEKQKNHMIFVKAKMDRKEKKK